MLIRPIRHEDVSSLAAIYNDCILNTVITFEECPLSEEAFGKRAFGIAEHFPYLVALKDETPIGFAYLSPFSDRSAYRFTADLSIYVRTDERSVGVGSMLLEAVLTEARRLGLRNIISVITDENRISVSFHEKHGFRCVGHLPDVGFKMGRRLGVFYYQRAI